MPVTVTPGGFRGRWRARLRRRRSVPTTVTAICVIGGCGLLWRRSTGCRGSVPTPVPAGIASAVVVGGGVVGGVGRGLGLLTHFGAGFRARGGGILGKLHPDHGSSRRPRSGSRPTRCRARPGSRGSPASASPGFGTALGG